MEIPRFANKENLFELKVCQISSASIPPPHLLPAPQTILKRPQTIKVKPQKGFTANVRAGDWVCLRCKNLNFAFRSECNRCQLQIKDQTKFQSYYPSENSSPNENSQKRAPFKDLTNLKCSTPEQSSFEALPSQDRHAFGERDASPQGSISQFASVKTNKSPVGDGLKSDPNKGFNNVLLVTPPKRRHNPNLNFLQEDIDLNQTDLPPYKSPKCLPSITSMLEQLVGDHNPNKACRRSHFFMEEKSGHQLIQDSNFFHFGNYGSSKSQEIEEGMGLGNRD